MTPSKNHKARSRALKLALDGMALVMFAGLGLWLTRPWIAEPRTRMIGYAGPMIGDRIYLIGNPDVVMNMTFAGWLKFSALHLHQWPLADTRYLNYPTGASHGASFDGLLLAGVAAALACAMPLATGFSVALVLGVVLNGYVFYRMAYRLWGRGALALALGLNAAGLPFLAQRLGTHANLVYIWTIPAAVHLYLNFERKPTLKRAAAWALSFPLLALGSWHVLLIGMVFQGMAALLTALRGVRRREWARLGGLALACGAGGALVAAVGWPMLAHAGTRATRAISVLTMHSTPLLQQIMPYPYSWVGRFEWVANLQQRIGTPWEAWSGGPLASLALLILYMRWARPEGPRALIALTALAALGISMGPILQVCEATTDGLGAKLPLYFLCTKFPALSLIHVPGRYSVLLHFMALLATGFMLQTWRNRSQPEGWIGRVIWPTAAWGVVGINLVCSLGAYPVATATALKVPGFYAELGRRPGKGAVMDVPISNYLFPQYNLFQFEHQRPEVSSVLFHDAVPYAEEKFPYQPEAMRFFTDKNKGAAGEDVIAEIVQPEFMKGLAAKGIQYVVVHPAYLEYLRDAGRIDPKTMAGYEKIEAAWRKRMVWRDGEIRVYRTGEE